MKPYRKQKSTRKKADETPKIVGLGPSECCVCGAPRPGKDTEPLPFEWNVHVVNDETYAKGYRMPLSCSDNCRRKGGLLVWR